MDSTVIVESCLSSAEDSAQHLIEAIKTLTMVDTQGQYELAMCDARFFLESVERDLNALERYTKLANESAAKRGKKK